MSINKVLAHCKFCGKMITLSLDADCPGFDLAKMLPLAACNRCADAARRTYQLRDQITSTGVRYHVQRQDPFLKPAERTEVDASARNRLVDLTKAFCRAVCDFHRQPHIWHSQLVDQILKAPDYAFVICKKYEQSFKPFRQPPAQAELAYEPGQDPF